MLALHFWPEHDVRQARNRLSHTLHLIRQAICNAAWDANWIYVQDELVFLDERITTDIEQIRAAAAAGLAADNESLFRHYGCLGVPFDPDIEGPLGERVRARLAQDQKTLQYRIVERMVAAGDIPAAMAQLQRIIKAYPGDEHAFRQLMAFAGRIGRHHDVIRLYRQARKEMAEAFGLKPSAQTQELAARAMEVIRGDSNGPVKPSSEQLGVYRPEPVDRLIRWSREQSGICNLVGASGMGKSVVLSQFLRSFTGTNDQTAMFFDLAVPAERRAAQRMLSAQDPCRHPDILVLDHVLSDADFAAFSQDLPLKNLKLIIASRIRLSVAVSVIRLTPLSLPSSRAAGTSLLPSASSAMFLLHCQDGFDQAEQASDRNELFLLLEFCAGWPALLRLAARKCVAATPGETLRLVSTQLGALDDTVRAPSDTATRTVGQLFQESLNGTDTAVGVLGSLLAMIVEPITLDQAVETIEQVLPEYYSKSYAAIETLLDLGFVRAHPSDGPPEHLSVAPVVARCFEAYASPTNKVLSHETVRRRLVAWLAEHIGTLVNHASSSGKSFVETLNIIESSRPLMLTLLRHGNRSEQVFRLAVLGATPWLILRRSPDLNEELFSAVHKLAPSQQDGAVFGVLATVMQRLTCEHCWDDPSAVDLSALDPNIQQAISFALTAVRVRTMPDVRLPESDPETSDGVLGFLSRQDSPHLYDVLPRFARLNQLLLQDQQEEFEQGLLSDFRACDEQAPVKASRALWVIRHCWRSGQTERAGHWVTYLHQYLVDGGQSAFSTKSGLLIRCQLACYMLMTGQDSLIAQLELAQPELTELLERPDKLPTALSLLAIEASMVQADRLHNADVMQELLPIWMSFAEEGGPPCWQSYTESIAPKIEHARSVVIPSKVDALARLDQRARMILNQLR
ncbi:MAG: BTAD domain-containing putative transcriptional regulator [Burkholderiaceae bacterium]